MTKTIKNVAASVRARLLEMAKMRREDFQLVLTRYANERLLYRISVSPHSSSFVLKGATLLMVWTGKPHRATRDVDLLGFGEPSVDRMRTIMTEVLEIDVVDDGLTFDISSLDVGPIREDQRYGGLRTVLNANVGGAKVRLQLDVGFGDVVTPAAVELELPAMLEFPTPTLRTYPRETVVAEKVEAMVQLGLANSRMKDFYDLVLLSRTFEFDGSILVRAIKATFERRRTQLPSEIPIALTKEFVEDSAKVMQWTAFLRKADAREGGTLASTAAELEKFMVAPLLAAAREEPFPMHWRAGGPWQ